MHTQTLEHSCAIVHSLRGMLCACLLVCRVPSLSSPSSPSLPSSVCLWCVELRMRLSVVQCTGGWCSACYVARFVSAINLRTFAKGVVKLQTKPERFLLLFFGLKGFALDISVVFFSGVCKRISRQI